MPRLVLANDSTSTRRRVYFDIRNIADGITPETGETGGQPQISTNGGAWTNTGIGVLTHIGNGRYYADLTQSAISTAGDIIISRYKSSNTIETPGDMIQVVSINLYDTVRMGLTSLPNAVVDSIGGLMTQINSTNLDSTATDAITTSVWAGIRSSNNTTGSFGEGVNIISISGDSVAADNAELFFDNTGFNASNSTIGSITNVTNIDTFAGYTITSNIGYNFVSFFDVASPTDSNVNNISTVNQNTSDIKKLVQSQK